MFADHPLRKLAYLDWKISILPSRPMEISFKGLTHDSDQNLEFFPLIRFKQNGPWNNVSWPSGYKTSLPRLKNKDFTKSPYGDFFKGVNPWFSSKITIFSFACC